MKLKKLVIPFDPPVQVAACSIVSLALISIKPLETSPFPDASGHDGQVSTSPVLEPLAAESLWPWGSAR